MKRYTPLALLYALVAVVPVPEGTKPVEQPMATKPQAELQKTAVPQGAKPVDVKQNNNQQQTVQPEQKNGGKR